jgi:hypothetical protein
MKLARRAAILASRNGWKGDVTLAEYSVKMRIAARCH